MQIPESPPNPSSIQISDLLLALYRHRWKIILFSFLGLAAAATVYFLTPNVYESRAKLLLRYVMERSSVDPLDPKVNPTGPQNGSIINAEMEILASLDLAILVADTLGTERLAPKVTGPNAKALAIKSILDGTQIAPPNGGNVITIGFRSPDPELARSVLDELIKRYFDKHLEVHRSTGAFGFVTEQTQQAKSRLRLTQDELQKRKAAANISSVAESTANINARLSKSEQDLLLAETELAIQIARLKSIESAATATPPIPDPSTTTPKPPQPSPTNPAKIQEYKTLVTQVAQLRMALLELLTKYTPESKVVTSSEREIERLNLQLRDLEKQFPSLLASLPSTSTNAPRPPDLLLEKAQLFSAQAKVDSLKSQLAATQEQAARIALVGPQIAELERKKDAEEASLKYMESSLEKARTDEALDPSKIPNISIVQRPSFGAKVTGETKKLVTQIAASGLAFGIALALFLELVLNRTVKQTYELETRLGIPQMLAIPHLSPKQITKLRLQNSPNSSPATLSSNPSAPWSPTHFIRSFAEEIRDRLILSFQLRNLTHKPKLVGVAGLSGGEGTTTIAAGIAAALSETGDGKVLLVNMHSTGPEAHPFLDGKPAFGLLDALNGNDSLPPTAENLYLANGATQTGGVAHLAAKRFYDLIPNLKASQFDYIIFDLPPLTHGSATLAIAGCLDTLLFVVEAEKSPRIAVKRAYDELVESKATVAGIINKTRPAGPLWLHS